MEALIKNISRFGSALVLVCVAVVSVVTAQDRKLTLEWIFGAEGRGVANLPSTTWLDDGSLIMLDSRRPAHERTFEKLDPATGARQPIIDRAKAVANLNTSGMKTDSLPWPSSFDGAGSEALYSFNGDVFVLQFSDASLKRLTSTPAEETSASFSPNGRRVAYVRENNLYFFDLDSNRETQLTRDGSETLLNGTLSWVYWEEVFGRRDIGYWWAPDSNGLAYLQSDDSQVDLAYFTDIQPFSPRVIKQRYARAGRANPTVRLGMMELAAPTVTTWVNIKDKPFEYIVRANWLPDGRRLSLQTMPRLQTELSLYFADRKTGAATRVLTETDPGWVNMNDDLYFYADGQHFLWPSERDGYMHLYRYRTDGTLVNQVTKGKWALASAGGIAFWVHQSLVGVDEKNDWIYFTALERSSIERHLYRVHSDGSGFKGISKEPGTHRISMSLDAKYYLDRYSDIRTQPALRLHASDGGAPKTLASPRPELLAQFDVQYPELSTIPAEDGFPMPAQILKPKNFQPGRKYPVIMYVYGGASAPQVSNSFQGDTLWYQLLLNEGYVIVKVDNRSATGISKTLENLIVKKVGEAEAPDLLSAARWLKKQSWVDPARLGVWGWSNGGWMTLNLMTRSQEFKAGISVAPVVDWRFYDSKWTEAAMRTPQENPEGYANASLIPRAKDLHGRLMIAFGTYDDNVHPYNELAFIDALIAAGKDFDMMAYPMRKHGISDEAATLHLYRKMLAFWKANL
jgi:dipeptidyl-peptidase-4